MATDALSFLHDSNAHRNPQITELRRTHGSQGYGIFWLLIEVLRESTDNKLHHNDLAAVAYNLHEDVDILESVVQRCCDLFLFVQDDESFWSDGLNKRVSAYLDSRKKVSQARREAGKKSGEARRKKQDEQKGTKTNKHEQDANSVEHLSKVKLSKDKLSEVKKSKFENISDWAKDQGIDLLGLDKYFDIPDPNDRDWVSLERLPLKSCPQIKLQPGDLEYSLSLFNDAGLPQSWYKHVFRAAYANCQEQIKAGKPEHLCRYIPAIQGYALQQVVKTYIDSERAKRNKQEARRPTTGSHNNYDPSTIKKLEKLTGMSLEVGS